MHTPRKAPCSVCGRVVVLVRTYRSDPGSEHGQLVAVTHQHEGRAGGYGDRVDEKCTWRAGMAASG